MIHDYESLQRWFADRGDFTHNLNYEINEKSIIIDLGGFHGLWVDEILKKNSPIIPKIILVEPVTEFYNVLVQKYKNIQNITVLNYGVSTNNKEETKKLYISDDGSSTHFNVGGKFIEIKTIPIEKILKDEKIENVDLLQINIEGDEYGLLEHMIENDLINKFKNVQVQFHLGVSNDIERRDTIQKNLLSLGFINKFNYPFVWESWTNKN